MTTGPNPQVPVSAPAHAHRRPATRLYAWAASTLAAAAGFTLVYANMVVAQVDGAFTPVDNSALVSHAPLASSAPDAAEGEAINILLMGSDARDGRNGDIGGNVTEGMRNDTTIIMHISADRSRVDLVSIPRDAQVEIPECKYFDGTTVAATSGDFNISFSNGGLHGDPGEAAACVINTVQKMSGITIDHWAVVDFAGFEDMVNALGGVPMCIPEKIVSKKARLSLDAGPQVLSGRQALGLARMRTAEVGDVSGSDLQRIARQHELLRQVARVVLSKNLLTDAGELTQFLKATASALTMDPELANTRYLLGLGFSLRNISPSAIQFHTIPWEYTEDRNNVLILDEAATMWEQMRNDQPLTAVGEESAGNTWDQVIDKSPEPVATDTDVTTALLSECSS